MRYRREKLANKMDNSKSYERLISNKLIEMPMPQNLKFKTKKEWRKWLQENHNNSSEAWVVIYKKNSEQQGLRYIEAVEEALCFGWIDSKMKKIDEDTFKQRFSPRRKKSIWSKSNKELALRLMKEQKMTKAGYEAIEEAKKSGSWKHAYTSKTPPEIPKDLEEALAVSPKAQFNFQTFPNSTKLIYVHWINNAKKPETRSRRIKQVVERAEKNIKPS
jgi:uncharacterized protein YdeI (YjbR/CyaY-like superfamily)